MAPVIATIPIPIPNIRMRSIREQHEDFGVVPLVEESPSQILQDSHMINDCFFGSDAHMASPLFKRRISNEFLTNPEEHNRPISSNNDYSPLIRTGSTNTSNISSPLDWEQQWSPYEPDGNPEGGVVGEIRGVRQAQKERYNQQTMDSSVCARGEGSDDVQWNNRRNSFGVNPASSPKNDDELTMAAINNDRSAETMMIPDPGMDLESSWIEKWMDMNGIFDPTCDFVCSDIDLPPLCEVNDNESNSNTNSTDNSDNNNDNNTNQIIASDTSHSQEPPQTMLVTMTNASRSSNDVILMDLDQRNFSPATTQRSLSPMVPASHEISNNNEATTSIGWNYRIDNDDRDDGSGLLIRSHHQISSPTNGYKAIADVRNAGVAKKSLNNTRTYVLRPAPKASVRLISQMPLNEQNRRSVKVIKASCNARNSRLHSYPYLHDLSEDEPYLSTDDDDTDHMGYAKSRSRRSEKSASRESVRSTNSSMSRRCTSTSPHISEKKREQNRSAAIRYRDKRREEAKRKKQELHDLELRNVELKTQVSGLNKEISYLKTILNEVLDN